MASTWALLLLLVFLSHDLLEVSAKPKRANTGSAQAAQDVGETDQAASSHDAGFPLEGLLAVAEHVGGTGTMAMDGTECALYGLYEITNSTGAEHTPEELLLLATTEEARESMRHLLRILDTFIDYAAQPEDPTTQPSWPGILSALNGQLQQAEQFASLPAIIEVLPMQKAVAGRSLRFEAMDIGAEGLCGLKKKGTGVCDGDFYHEHASGIYWRWKHSKKEEQSQLIEEAHSPTALLMLTQCPKRIPQHKGGKGKYSALCSHGGALSGTPPMEMRNRMRCSSRPLRMGGFGIIDCGATQTVGSLPAHVEEVEFLAAPFTHFKFGNGTFIFVAVNPNLAIPLRGGKTGHLSIDFRGDWMQQGFRMDAIHLHIQRGDVSEEETYLADCPAGSSESVHVEHACTEQPAPDDVHVSSCVPPDDPTAQSSKDMKASLSALASLVALHFHGKSPSCAMPLYLGDGGHGQCAPKAGAKKEKAKSADKHIARRAVSNRFARLRQSLPQTAVTKPAVVVTVVIETVLDGRILADMEYQDRDQKIVVGVITSHHGAAGYETSRITSDYLVIDAKAVYDTLMKGQWAMIFLGLFIVAGGILLGGLLHGFTVDPTADADLQLWTWRHYGTASRAIYTMFEITFAGSWPLYARPVIEDIAVGYSLFFVAYIVFVVFAVIRVISAIFLKETLDAAQNDAQLVVREKAKASQEYIKRLNKVFRTMDVSQDGVVSKDEFLQLCQDPTIRSYMTSLDVDVNDGSHLFKLLDDGDGNLTYDEFIAGMMRFKGSAKAIDVIYLQREVEWLQMELLRLSHAIIGPNENDPRHKRAGRRSSGLIRAKTEDVEMEKEKALFIVDAEGIVQDTGMTCRAAATRGPLAQRLRRLYRKKQLRRSPAPDFPVACAHPNGFVSWVLPTPPTTPMHKASTAPLHPPVCRIDLEGHVHDIAGLKPPQSPADVHCWERLKLFHKKRHSRWQVEATGHVNHLHEDWDDVYVNNSGTTTPVMDFGPAIPFERTCSMDSEGVLHCSESHRLERTCSIDSEGIIHNLEEIDAPQPSCFASRLKLFHRKKHEKQQRDLKASELPFQDEEHHSRLIVSLDGRVEGWQEYEEEPLIVPVM
ncbi:unnamed protein product [Symbiodinium sp. KB8]|nr:unnamed protein product [Symbiodinium sp. KB8]